MAKTIRSITVEDLIARLQQEAPDALVVFASDYGDYSHTQQVHKIEGTIEEVPLVESAYSRSGWAVDENGEEDLDTVNVVLVIR